MTFTLTSTAAESHKHKKNMSKAVNTPINGAKKVNVLTRH